VPPLVTLALNAGLRPCKTPAFHRHSGVRGSQDAVDHGDAQLPPIACRYRFSVKRAVRANGQHALVVEPGDGGCNCGRFGIVKAGAAGIGLRDWPGRRQTRS